MTFLNIIILEPSASASATAAWTDSLVDFGKQTHHRVLRKNIMDLFKAPFFDKFQTFSACFGRRFWERVAQQQKQLVTRVFTGLQGLNNLFRFSDPCGSRLLFLANSMRKVPGDFVWDTDGQPVQ